MNCNKGLSMSAAGLMIVIALWRCSQVRPRL